MSEEVSDYEKGIEAAIEGGLADGLTHVAWVPFREWMSDRINRFLAVQPEVWWCATHGDVQSGDGRPCYRAMAFPERGQRCTRGHKARIVVQP